MEKYNLIKMRNYLVHLVIGTAVLLFGGGVLCSIVSEMVEVYDPASKYAYICGIVFSGLILAVGFFFLMRAFGFEKRLFKKFTSEERADFLAELPTQDTKLYGKYVFVTPDYILVYSDSWSPSAKLVKVKDLIACFGKPYYAGSEELVRYDLILCDKRFQLYRCCAKGKDVVSMEEAHSCICEKVPWVFSDDYEEFMTGLSKRAKKKAYLRTVQHRREIAEQTGHSL